MVFRGRKREVCQYYNTSNLQEAYHRLSRSSLFGACPRGDNAFSYRFTEQLSCGTIPVIYSDGWVLPFSYGFIDWEDVAVVIPEAQVDRSLEILQSIPAERLCDMQRKGLELYNRYLRDGIGVVAGIIETLELQHSTLTESYSIFPSNTDDKQLTNACSTPTASSPLRDKSLCWDDTVDRIWMRHNITHPTNPIPPGMLLVTNFGWFHPINHIHYHRSWLSTELLEGVINHPWLLILYII